MANKIFARNLTARATQAARYVVGNPTSARLESGVANCFPGLELDLRNLDCRFFPGLIFQFVIAPRQPVPEALPNQEGCRLLYVDYLEDPTLPETSEHGWVQALLSAYKGATGTMLSKGRWYLDWIEQGGTRIVMYDDKGKPYDGEIVWRLVRGLEADLPLTIGLIRRDADRTVAKSSVLLRGYRRRYVNEAGMFDESYRPGELTQAMCNPWTHDFRDCACHYWAANRPDIVLAEARSPSNHAQPTESTNPVYADWMRRDRSPAGVVAALGTIAQNRPFQFDHYEINQVWEKLPFVLEGKELEDEYKETDFGEAIPYDSSAEMIRVLEEELAPMELTVAFQYLYALFSIHQTDEVPATRWPTMHDDVVAIRRIIALIAIGEMTHLRWVNQILWELHRAGAFPDGKVYRPVLKIAHSVPDDAGRPPLLRPLTPEALEYFLRVETPTAHLSKAYARCAATLRNPRYPAHLCDLAMRIYGESLGHLGRFEDVKRIVMNYDGADGLPYLRTLTMGTPKQAEVALQELANIMNHIENGFTHEANQRFADAQTEISAARSRMTQLQIIGEELARNGIGIPFWAYWGR
jgi:hypothetical protein